MSRRLLECVLILICSMGIKTTAEDAVPEPKSWTFPEVIEYAREITPDNVEGKPFNKFGMVYSQDELSKLILSEQMSFKSMPTS